MLRLLTDLAGITKKLLINGLKSQKKRVDIVVLDFPLLDTRKTEENGDMRNFISDLVVQILAYMAEMERKKNRESQRMGIEAMKERGEWERYGRPQAMDILEFKKAYEMVENGTYQNKELMALLGMKRSTYYSYCKKLLKRD